MADGRLRSKPFYLLQISVYSLTVPVERPGNLQASHGNSKLKLSVKWDSVPVDVRNGILLGYHVYYHESLSSNDVKNITSTKTYVLLTGLETHTSYDIRVCGFTAAGDGVCSAVTALTRANGGCNGRFPF